MKYLVLTLKEKRIMYICNSITENNNIYYMDNGIGILKSICEIKKVKSIPEEVIPEKYCYVNGEFVLNPDWVEPEEPEENNEG